MTEVVSRIENASGEELDAIVDAVVLRYGQLYPDWEVMFLSLPKTNAEERKRAIRETVVWFENDLRFPK